MDFGNVTTDGADLSTGHVLQTVHEKVRWPITIAWATLGALGVLTNICNITVLTRFRLSSLVLYLRCMSVFDLGFCVTGLCTASFVHFGYASYAVIVIYMYVVFPVHLLFIVLGTCILVIISTERAFGTLFPFIAQRNISPNASKVIVAVMVVVVAVVRLPLVYASFGFREISTGRYAQVATPFFYTRIGLTLWIVTAVLFEFTPFIILLISNCIVIRSVWRLKKNLCKLTSEAVTMDPKVSIMLVGIVILFLICEVPLTISRIVNVPREISIIVEPLTGALIFLNRSANMFIYLGTSAEYRHHLRARLGCEQSGQVEPIDPNSNTGAATNTTQIWTRQPSGGNNDTQRPHVY